MMPVVRIPDELFGRLQRHAEPLVDSVADVITRILDQYDGATPQVPAAPEPAALKPASEIQSREDFWVRVATIFNGLQDSWQASDKPVQGRFKQIFVGKRNAHYEWIFRKGDKSLDVSLHFESSDRESNFERLKPITAAMDAIQHGEPYPFETLKFGKTWSQARFRIGYEGEVPSEAIAQEGARVMKLLIERTLHLVAD